MSRRTAVRGRSGRPREFLTCRRVTELVTAYLEHALEPAATACLEEHLSHCVGCVAYVEQMRATIRALAQLEPTPIPIRVRADLAEADRTSGAG